MTSGSAWPPHAATAIAETPSNADNVSVFHVLNTLKILPYFTNENKPQFVLSCRNVCADAEIATTPDKYRAVRHVSSIDHSSQLKLCRHAGRKGLTVDFLHRYERAEFITEQ